MRISKKLSVLVGTVALAAVQQTNVDPAVALNAVLEGVKELESGMLYYLSGVYIVIQGVVDAIQKWKTNVG